MWFIFFRFDWLIDWSIDWFDGRIEIICNISNVFTVIFYQFNVPMLNKSINFLFKNLQN